MTFKKLGLKRDLIGEAISSFSETATVCGPIEKGNATIYTIVVDNQPPASLNFYFNNDGTTTINPKSGKNVDLSRLIAERVKEKCSLPENKLNKLYIKNISKENLNYVFEYLKEEHSASLEGQKKISSGIQYKIQGKQGDVLFFNHYTNDALHVQGKPLLIYWCTMDILFDLLPNRDLIESQLKTIDVEYVDVNPELQTILINSYGFLDDKIKTVLSPALVFRKLNIELGDYTSFVFPVLKGLEGYIKKLFLKHHITIGKEGFRNHFTKNGNKHNLKSNYKSTINCINTCNAIEKSYSYYNNQRHGLFHYDSFSETTRTLENQKDADLIITKTLELIEETYSKIE